MSNQRILVEKSQKYMPRNLDNTEALGVLIQRIAAVAPSVQLCEARAEREVFPQVRNQRFTMEDAIRKCGRDVNVVLGISPIEKLDLSRIPTPTLLQAWGALNFYSSRLKPDITQNLRALQEKIGQLIMSREPQPAQGTAAVVYNTPSAPPVQKAAPAPSVTPDPIPTTDSSEGKRRRGGAWGGKLGIVAVAVFIAFALLFNDVTKVEKAIDEIGPVTMASREQIEEVEAMYEDLSDTRKGKVENYDILLAARAEYNRLVAAINKAIRAIEDIGTVHLGSEPKILAARQAYNDLAKDNLTEYAADYLPTLQNAEARFAEIDSVDLFDTAMKLFQERKFDQALEKFEEFLRKYSDYDQAKVCKEHARDCMIQQAEKLFQENKVEATIEKAKAIKAKYGDSDEYKKLWKKIENRLQAIRPVSGRTFLDTAGSGRGQFEVKAGDQDAYIKLISTEDAECYKTFYVRANETAVINIQDGDYTAEYYTGQYWFDEETLFGKDTKMAKTNDVFSFGTNISGQTLFYNKVSISMVGDSGSKASPDADE